MIESFGEDILSEPALPDEHTVGRIYEAIQHGELYVDDLVHIIADFDAWVTGSTHWLAQDLATYDPVEVLVHKWNFGIYIETLGNEPYFIDLRYDWDEFVNDWAQDDDVATELAGSINELKPGERLLENEDEPEFIVRYTKVEFEQI